MKDFARVLVLAEEGYSNAELREVESMNVPAMIDAKVANSLKGVLIDLIQRDYQFIAGDKIQEMFASDVAFLLLVSTGTVSKQTGE